jgi:CDP-glucose 4,6-dehydratase
MTNYWENRNVLITGCTGFLGSWLCEELINAKANVVGIIRDWVPKSRLISENMTSSIVTVRAQIEDLSSIERTINEYEIQTVFHLAAQTIVGTANRDPVGTFETNIKGTWNLLEACRRIGSVKNIVVASSDKAYGIQEHLPYNETMDLNGRFPYDVSKACTDLLAQSYHASYDLPVCITRCANFYGGGDLNFNRLVPGTIMSLLRGENPLIRSDGSYIRDYLYIKDAARACMNLAEKMETSNIKGEAFNISSEIRCRADELVSKITTLMGLEKLKPIILNQASREIPHQYLSSKKSMDLLEWKSTYSLEQGLAETIQWYQQFYEENKQND